MSQHALDGFVTNTTGGLTRLLCSRCKSETIHRGLTCIHCKSKHVSYPVRDLASKWVASGMTIVRKSRRGARK